MDPVKGADPIFHGNPVDDVMPGKSDIFHGSISTGVFFYGEKFRTGVKTAVFGNPAFINAETAEEPFGDDVDMTEETGPMIWAMEMSGYFQMHLLKALTGP